MNPKFMAINLGFTENKSNLNPNSNHGKTRLRTGHGPDTTCSSLRHSLRNSLRIRCYDKFHICDKGILRYSDPDASQDASERFGTHGKNLWITIGRVEKLDKGLAEELGREYYGMLEAMSDMLERMKTHLEH